MLAFSLDLNWEAQNKFEFLSHKILYLNFDRFFNPKHKQKKQQSQNTTLTYGSHGVEIQKKNIKYHLYRSSVKLVGM